MQTTTPSPVSGTSAKNAVRAFASTLIAAVALLAGGRAQAATQSELVLFAEHSPLPQIVARGTEMTAAERAAEERHGCFAVLGEGCSMEPIYLAGTALVVRVGGYDRLQAGKAVVYRNHRGVAVAHMLVRHTRYGWVSVGLNNLCDDSDVVTEDNFVGVIAAAFAAKTGSLPEKVMARVALDTQVRNSSKLASANL